ncbi:hypothetical protein IKW75_01500 [Candidatus Saccharibacteria bacterium]|nr:hypothetical protein [Candidatus Saccharibacteria bacterium]
MVFDIHEVGGISEFATHEVTLGEGDDAETVTIYETQADEPRVFLVVRKNTLEVRTDDKLRDLLREKYESVMESRYFGKGGIEIVNSGQLTSDQVNDLVRLSYQMSID